MLRGNKPVFSWSENCQSSFDSLRKRITEHLLLAIFDLRCETSVNCDASDVGLGATLTQIQHGKEVTISSASHTLSSVERNFAAAEKECLACVWACERFSKYLLGRHLTLNTDQRALEKLLPSLAKVEDIRKSSKFVRWAERLSAFDFTPHYRPGVENFVPDTLSRLPLPSSEPAVHDYTSVRLVSQIHSHGISLADIDSA